MSDATTRRARKGVDPRVYDLAVFMLGNEKGATDAARTELAEEIQEVCEDFIEDLREKQQT